MGRIVRTRGLTAIAALLVAAGPAAAQDVADEPADGVARTYPIDRAVEIALRNNRDLRVAELDLATAEKQVDEAYGSLFPEIDGTASYQRNLAVPESFLPAIIIDPDADPDELIPVRFGAENDWRASINVDQPLFDAALFIGVSTAGRFRDYSREALRGAAQRIATNVRIAYLDVLLAEQRLLVTRNSVDRVALTLEESRALNRVGLLGEYDVLRLEVELANIEPELRRSRDFLAEARRTLAIEMGLSVAEPVGAEGNLTEVNPDSLEANTPDNRLLLAYGGVVEPAAASPEVLLERAWVSRSDLRQVALQRELEEARVRVARTELLPSVTGFFTAGVFSQENGAPDFFGENTRQRTTTSAVGLRVDVPIFSGLRRWNRVEQRQIAVRQVESQLADLRLRAENEVRSRWSDVTEARARARAQVRAVGEATRGFEIASLRYREGTGSRLEVTDAELALRQAELNYAQAVYDFLVARARLDLAVGEVPSVTSVMDEMIEDPGAERRTVDETNDR